MKRIEDEVETMEQPINELQNELKVIVVKHQKMVNSFFMSVNERCTNLQQMTGMLVIWFNNRL